MMNPEEQLIHTFYSAFQRRDFATMQACYAEDAIFNDPIFTNLDAAEVRAMWQMLLERSGDIDIKYSSVTAGQGQGAAHWVATYTFSKTGRKVTNRIDASFQFNNGKISRHTDVFDFARWARQSLGMTGLLLGNTAFLKNKIRTEARKTLDHFMRKQKSI